MAPMNGWAYTPIELEAIWAIPVDHITVINAYEPFFEFHLRASTLAANPWKDKDRAASKMIERAAMAETVNATTPPPVWPCPEHHDDGTPRSKDNGA